MILSFHPVVVSDVQIILGDRALGPWDFARIERADAIILPQSCSRDLYRACRESSALLFPNYDKRYDYEGKVGQSRLFQEQGWPHPATLQWHSAKNLEEYLLIKKSLPHRFPFFLKRDMGHEGEGLYLIRDFSDLAVVLENIRNKKDFGFVSQEFVLSEGNVLRVVVMGKHAHTYWKRPSTPGDLITTIGSGGKIDPDWRPELQEIGALQAGRIAREGLIDLAALDFVFSLDEPDPQPLLLEINYYFGRRGFGGSLQYYRMLIDSVREWLETNGLDSERVSLA